MKTLNRTLSLALVFALVFSLMSFAFAATTTTATTTAATKLSDFTDSSKLTYTEAADYLIAAGIVAGDTATTINPQGDFTREQAAKLISYACLGQSAADNLKAGSAPFTDVAADRWSAGYIAYCQKNNIINGLGDGTFNPAAKVTGYQYAKMLLCALGYGVNGEFTGAGWDLEVAKLALAKDIFKDHTVGASNASANREEAFLYTFNALTNAMIVNYNKSLNVYYSGTNPFENEQAFTSGYTIGYQRFKMVSTPATAGAKGETRHYWAIDSKKVTGNYADKAVTVLAKSANGTAYGDLVSDSKTTYIGYSADSTVNYYYNGDKVTETADIAAAKTAVDTKGVTVSFIDTDKNGKYNTVFVEKPTLAKITAAPTVSTSGNVTIVTVPGITGLTEINADNVDGYTGLAKGDYVMYYANSDASSYTIAKCEAKTGKIFGYNELGNKLNFNGTNVDMTEIASADQASEVVANGLVGVDNITAYTDANGYIVKVISTDATVALNNFVYIAAASDPAETMVVTAKAVFADGTNSVINVAKAPATLAGATVVANQKPQAGFYTYTKDSSNNYSLKAIPGTYTQNAAGTEITSGKAVFSDVAGILATSTTAFVVAKTSGYTLYTGITKVPNYASGTVATLYLNDGSYAKFVVAFGGTASASGSSDYAFITLPVSMNVVKSDDPFEVYYNSVVNGETGKELDAVNGEGLSAGTLYEIKGYDNGRVSDEATTAGAAGGTNLIHDFTTMTDKATSFEYSNGTLTTYAILGGTKTATNNVVLSSDCKVFLYDATKEVPTLTASSADALESLATSKTYQVKGIEKSLSDHSIAQLFVTIVPDTKFVGLATLTANVATDGAVTFTPAFNAADLKTAYAKTGCTASQTITVSATATSAALGGTVTYSNDGTTYASTLPTTTTNATASATRKVYVKVTYGTASQVYTLTFTTHA